MTRSEQNEPNTNDLDWNDLRYFLEVARNGSFSRAANALNTHQSTISRRVALLEHRLGSLLAVRTAQGVLLTDDGIALRRQAERMEQILFEVRQQVIAGDSRLAGPVRIGSTDGFGVFWITPRLPRFGLSYPDIQVQLHCSETDPRLDRLEADIVLRLGHTNEANSRVEVLGAMPFSFYASPNYLANYGTPKTLGEMADGHRLVLHDYYPRDGLWAGWTALADKPERVAIQTNSSAALVAACRAGLGIALLSDYAREVVPDLVRLAVDWERPTLPVILVSHAETGRAARVEAMLSYLREEYSQWMATTSVISE
ncbi:LysR family transcriptional regulator [Lacibacterium aquatile]|uniref:LysR family transcriptional regulator n=1 Tax=Lacibacterium aquatile TaxID=1168082 RepID=A0ABW5DW05_9PROT